ncbi:hypothetical protein TraAM80_06820 [Trypanosoma rangeli]|uniref:Uncharacterized protein n=1 Tax=Trypanosoma rangeli TaxID=5698 RepID=A0A422N8B4_TRYRA|nr:uncharacterized protein TraAM80_06820 [Trypanosoma rangeli]RNF01697.1 hypothetical protein TraAM80_06820 [Trypanosoma rangeli]|eukprot:RNF01697.1 hypothetical protein TraAM80_06820 [Trypanosoma rangeli]
MDESIIKVPFYTTTSAWRMQAQMQGLLRNHPSLIADSGPLAAPGTVFTTARLSLHNSENALALGLNPLGAGGSVGLMSVEGPEPTLQGATHMRWLDMPPDVCVSSIDWCDEHLLVGSTRGRILLVKAGLYSVNERSGILDPSGCLVSGDTQPVVGDIIVAPSSHAVSTLVRSVQCNAEVKSSSVVAVVDSRAMVWDIEGGASPLWSWTPGVSPEAKNGSQHDVLLFAKWAPHSDSVVLTGSYDGSLLITDIRASESGMRSLSLPMRRGFMARCADFNTLLPFVVAAASSDGTITVFDCRFPGHAVRTISSLQGDVASLRWLRLHSDILATGGIDGTVAMWNLRFAPTYCVGRAQYKYPVVDLAATVCSVEQRLFGLTAGGELTLTGLASSALSGLAPSVTSRVHPPYTEEGAPHLREQEQRGVGLLYARRLQEAHEVITDCAMERFTRKDTAVAMTLVNLTDVMVVPKFDYKDMIAGNTERLFAVEETPHTQALEVFNELLARSSERLCMTLPLRKVRDIIEPNPEDLKKVEALRLNLLLQHVLHTGDPEKVISGIQLFSANAGNLDLVDTNTACSIARMLLREKENYIEGEKFMRAFLSLLIQQDGTVLAHTLARRLLIVVQEPLTTEGLPPRQAKRHEERFLYNLLAAQEAVQVQLAILGMGIERYQQVIATVNGYQKSCLEKGESGIFGWLGMRPILLFLHSLTADSNYATFFWACVQLMEASAKCPGSRQVESLLFSTVDRICRAAKHIQEQLQQAANTPHFTQTALREVGDMIRGALDFLVVLLRVHLECENVAIESGMSEIPPVMARIFDILSTASSDLLEDWATLLEKLKGCKMQDFVRKCCIGVVRNFSFQVEELMRVSVKKENDETLNEILDTCYDFLDTAVKGDED